MDAGTDEALSLNRARGEEDKIKEDERTNSAQSNSELQRNLSFELAIESQPCSQSDATTTTSEDRKKKSLVQKFLVSEERRWSVFVSAVIAAIPALLFGVTLGFPSNAILDLTGDATELPQEYLLSNEGVMLSLFVALAPVGAIFGGPVGGWISDRWGRKCSLMFNGVPYLVGYLILSYAHYASTATVFKTLLLTGRFMSGVGLGWACAVCPVYTAELSSAKLRGTFGNFFPSFLTTAIFGTLVLGTINGFRYYYTSLIAVGLVALFEISMFWLPETPRWLLSRKYEKRATRVLLWLRGKKVDIKKEVEEMKKSLSARKTKAWRLLLKRSALIPFIYTLILFATQQGGGINGITPYAGKLFSDAGLSNPRLTTIYALGVSGFVGLIVSFVFVDILGRKVLLVISGTGLFLGTGMLGIYFFITNPNLCKSNDTSVEENDPVCNPQYQLLSVFSITLFCFTFNVGYNSVPYIFLSELLPLPVRGIASGFAAALSWSCAALYSGFYLQFIDLVRPWFAMWGIAALNVAAILFVILLVPETKGKTLEETEKKFARKRDVRAVETVLQ